MRIGINALYLLPGKVGGSETYIRNLVKWLVKTGRRNEFFIFINKESVGVFEKIAPGINVILCPINASNRPVRILWEQIMLPLQVKKHKIDILFSGGMTSPFYCPAPSYVSIYDLQHINQPQNFPKFYLWFLRTIIYLSAKTSNGVLTLSGRSKADITRHYGIDDKRVWVTYLASDNKSFYRHSDKEISAVRKKYSLPERFILYIASSLPHKNYERLLEAFKTVKQGEDGIKLVLIGARDYGFDVIQKKIKELELEDDVVFLGWLPFEDIPLIYCASDVFVFPSLHEGFGIPVLEAMSCGVPVVCSKIEPLTEVAADAAYFVNPLDAGDMAKGISSVLRDKKLRDRLIKDGLKRAKEFSWERTAKDTLSAISSGSGGKACKSLQR
ncbi:MAG: glycosyltransferase family 4 protein [Deltaproteobacteria bacterium]|nr:glycosyltransferase family 4 protein [Deltaproteobacteria bacterium]